MAETSIQGMVHKAAADRLCAAFRQNRLPEGGPTAELRVYIEKDEVSVLLDLAGEPLFKRGYRPAGGIAPLRETTAAALVLLSGWKRKFPLYDPFCGSGSIAIEAALYARNIAPGLGRRFAISTLALADFRAEKQARDAFLEQADFDNLVRIHGSDREANVVAQAAANAERALGRERADFVPRFTALPMDQARAPYEEAGFIITNPPYGIRLGDVAEAEATYRAMASLARSFPGWKLVVISDHAGFESHFGRKADSCLPITNGAIQTYIYTYEQLL
jgi:putative N6-adenine-specific DNA methylase